MEYASLTLTNGYNALKRWYISDRDYWKIVCGNSMPIFEFFFGRRENEVCLLFRCTCRCIVFNLCGPNIRETYNFSQLNRAVHSGWCSVVLLVVSGEFPFLFKKKNYFIIFNFIQTGKQELQLTSQAVLKTFKIMNLLKQRENLTTKLHSLRLISFLHIIYGQGLK